MLGNSKIWSKILVCKTALQVIKIYKNFQVISKLQAFKIWCKKIFFCIDKGIQMNV